MARLRDEYKKDMIPTLMEKFNYSNTMQVPRITKIVVNVGMGAMAQEKELIEKVRDELSIITGQRPRLTRSRISISNFKIREGAPVGYKVTLRGVRMYEFLDRLINFCIPRIRDFRGVSGTAFDQNGNYTLGLKEQTIFSELDLNKIPRTHGMDICIVTTAKTKEEAKGLLEAFGMPFEKK
ncbi:MAG: 50S ribosomal protein L5 [Candidatus Omnitrophica bacterium]|nr:50S ribosomal protein L5 [Candidatus Omnitrophota bacterium]MBU1128442.1 50S ribosomal protein L5 [Candidatus Omnitrophota bacterium]MBU1657182.1 50S ribosomal protein L5 [Candidatus Omnitrophota bacterium]MBU1784432.1 50S ribosomal protein L5 [Candidatus Omnitrophota bacterium]MBU1851635.1 50S ribosomal protein L5 [Candidatus Omnitrophota bacterium]